MPRHADHPLERAAHIQPHPSVERDAAAPEVMRQLVAAPIQLPIREAPALQLDGNGVRSPGGLLLEALVDGRIARVPAPGVVGPGDHRHL